MRPVKELLNNMPKCELHIHGEAIVSVQTYYQLNLKYNVIDGINKPEDLYKMFDIKSLKDMIGNFYILQSLFRTSEDYMLFVKDVAEYCIDNNIVYMELYFSPSMVKRNGYVAVPEVYDILLNGFSALKDSGGPEIQVIVDISRSFGVENAKENLLSVISYNKNSSNKIIGIGLGGQEIGNSCLPYSDLFDLARENGLHVVIHAGEEVGPESIWEAIQCKAERIGHGTSAYLDSELINELSNKKIPIEVCPTSNIITGKIVKTYQEHPVNTFLSSNLCVCINTDDPVLFQTSLNKEYEVLNEECNIDENVLVNINRNAFIYSFSSRKDYYLDILDKYLSES